jgi:hypothetical protein
VRRQDRILRTYIRYKAAPVFLMFWVFAGTLVWAILLFALVTLGYLVTPILEELFRKGGY